MKADIISRFIKLLNDVQPTFSEELAAGIERRLREEYRGERVYIAKHTDNLHAIVRSRFSGDNVGQLAVELKISRRTVYRSLQRRNKTP